MKVFGLQITRAKAAPPVLSNVSGGWQQSLWGLIREPFAGAWQRNMEIETRQNITAYSPVYACIDLIANDIAKLRLKLMQQNPATGIWQEVRDESPFLRVLRKPNIYQTRFQFVHYWITSKLMYGNAYILKERELARGMVRALYCLDPRLVTTKVADDGSVWYAIRADSLSGLPTEVTVPASEIIHDRCATLFHPLVGVSPIYAAGSSSTQGIRIQANSEKFFANMSLPSGHLSAPGKISDETAARMKATFEAAVGGANIGRLFVSGDGITYQPFTIPAVDAQLIEQLRWTAEDVARPFHVPLHKINAGALPQVGNMAALNQDYYSQALQPHTEAGEDLLSEGLEVDRVEGKTYGVEFDLEGLLRMDPISRADRLEKLKNYITTDEGRASENYPPTAGGDVVLRQQQDYSLEALAKRDAKPDPFATAQTPAPEPAKQAEAANDADAVAEAAAKRIDLSPIVEAVAQTAEHVANLKNELAADREATANGFAAMMKQMLEGIAALKPEPEDGAEDQVVAVHGFGTKTLERMERAFAD